MHEAIIAGYRTREGGAGRAESVPDISADRLGRRTDDKR